MTTEEILRDFTEPMERLVKLRRNNTISWATYDEQRKQLMDTLDDRVETVPPTSKLKTVTVHEGQDMINKLESIIDLLNGKDPVTAYLKVNELYRELSTKIEDLRTELYGTN